MSISVRNLLKQRQYPFIASLILLLIFVASFLLTTNTSQPPQLPQPFSLTQSPLHETVNDSANATDFTTDRDLDDGGGSSSEDLGLEWNVCAVSMAVDYIPCLDNIKAIKSLRSRRHMEHRERHCPKPNPRCLIPLPQGYKVPVPWPKSRDMVRLLPW